MRERAGRESFTTETERAPLNLSYERWGWIHVARRSKVESAELWKTRLWKVELRSYGRRWLRLAGGGFRDYTEGLCWR